MSNFCETAYIIFSPLTFGVKSTDLPVFGSSIVHMQENANLNLKSIDIDTILLQNPENLLKISWIYNYGKHFTEWSIVFLYFPKYQIKIEYLLFVTSHVI